MDVDQFFNYGPRAPFEVQHVFTNREGQIQAFRDRFAELAERSWSIDDLLDFQRPAANLIAVSGEGGIGKSTLARHVAELAVTGALDGLPHRGARAVLDFADPASSSFETVLPRVRAALAPLARSWPAFDVALAVYWQRKHPGESLTAFLRKENAAESLGVADQVGAAVDQLLGGFGALSVAYRALNLLGRTATQKARLKRLRSDLPALDPILAATTGIRAPRLLDAGTTGDAWWAVLERLPGVQADRPTPARQRELGHQLRLWHSRPPTTGCGWTIPARWASCWAGHGSPSRTLTGPLPRNSTRPAEDSP